MNKGITHARSEYCLFLNSGDWLVNTKVLENVFSRPYSADVLSGNCNISTFGRVVFVARPSDRLTLKSFIKNTIPHQATFIKRTLFEQYGLYNEKYRLHADYDFWLRSIIIGQCSVEKIDVIVADYNMQGLSSDIENNPNIHQEALDILSDYFPQTVLDDYYTWIEESVGEAAVVFHWIKSSPIIYNLIKYLYKVSKLFRLC